MKKNLPIIISILVALLVVALCVFSYFYFTKGTKDETTNETISKDPIYTIENYPRVDASTATQPLAMAFIDNFTGKTVDQDTMNFTKTHEAYVKLINGQVDLILVTSPSEEELNLAKQKNVELEVIPVVREGFVFYVNAENKVNNLTVEQVQEIYSGKITNWSQVGGEDAKINAYQRPTNSGSQTGMLNLVMKGKKLMAAPKENVIEGMAAIINLVSAYENGKASIGYSYYYYATTMYQTIDKTVANNIKLLSINGIVPNEETIKTGTYPFTTSYYIVINKANKEDSAARKLANQMLSARGQSVAKEAGYVPVK